MGSPDYCGLHRPQLRPAPAWWPTLLKRDAFQHSQNSARRSITPSRQNRGPAKDEMGPPPLGGGNWWYEFFVMMS